MQKEATPQQIDDFLELFNFDAEAAQQALEDRGHVPVRQKPDRPISNKVVIAANNLTKEYQVGRQKISAINDVTLDIHEGEFAAITAPSGSGKSTLLQLLGGLESPTSGSISVNGTELSALNDGKLSEFRGQTIGFVFQFFYLQPFLTLERNLEVPGMFSRTDHANRQKRARELAEVVGIVDRLKHYPRELSGGQIQRAAIVRALLNNPKIVLADEPTGNLDSKNGEAIIALFEQIRDTFGTTIVIATHDARIAASADRVIRLKDGALM